MIRIDDNLTSAEQRLINTLKNKSRAEQDEILAEYERRHDGVHK